MTVFISYADDDKPVADAVCATLEAAGIPCWMAPRNIISLRVWLEVERAVNRAVMLVPMRIQDTRPAATLASYLVTVHWLDALTPPLETHLHRLAEKLKRHFAIKTATAPNRDALAGQEPSRGR